MSESMKMCAVKVAGHVNPLVALSVLVPCGAVSVMDLVIDTDLVVPVCRTHAEKYLSKDPTLAVLRDYREPKENS